MEGQALQVGGSSGVALYPEHGADALTLLHAHGATPMVHLGLTEATARAGDEATRGQLHIP